MSSEKRHAMPVEASSETWVFNWAATSGEVGPFLSRQHLFDPGVEQETIDPDEALGWGHCVLSAAVRGSTESHFVGFVMDGPCKGRVHAKFMMLDKFDKLLGRVFEVGSAAAPQVCDFEDEFSAGVSFTPTATEKDKGEREHGNMRLRAVVRVFTNEDEDGENEDEDGDEMHGVVERWRRWRKKTAIVYRNTGDLSLQASAETASPPVQTAQTVPTAATDLPTDVTTPPPPAMNTNMNTTTTNTQQQQDAVNNTEARAVATGMDKQTGGRKPRARKAGGAPRAPAVKKAKIAKPPKNPFRRSDTGKLQLKRLQMGKRVETMAPRVEALRERLEGMQERLTFVSGKLRLVVEELTSRVHLGEPVGEGGEAGQAGQAAGEAGGEAGQAAGEAGGEAGQAAGAFLEAGDDENIELDDEVEQDGGITLNQLPALV
ncbi:hypothetical protein T484DRAFT_1754191 [Baffinella frigidus]|nr:hypothetical protein T484DRAFT_1754191 [Cryptophyta sp. CCMP2293]